MNKFSSYVLGFLVSTSVTAIAGSHYNQCTDLNEKRAHVERKTLALKVYSRQLDGVIGQAVGASGKVPSHMEPLLHLRDRLNMKFERKQKLLQTLSEKKEEKSTTSSTESSKGRTADSLREEGQFWITSAQTLNTAGFKHSDDKLFGSWDLFQGYMDAHPTLKASITAEGMDPVSYAKLVSTTLLTYENVLAYVQEKAMQSTKRAIGLPVKQVADPYQVPPIFQQSAPKTSGAAVDTLPQQESVMAPPVPALSKPNLQAENERLLRDIILNYEEILKQYPLDQIRAGAGYINQRNEFLPKIVYETSESKQRGCLDSLQQNSIERHKKLIHALAIRCNSTVERVTKMLEILNNETYLSPDVQSVKTYVQSLFRKPLENNKFYDEDVTLENIKFKARLYVNNFGPNMPNNILLAPLGENGFLDSPLLNSTQVCQIVGLWKGQAGKHANSLETRGVNNQQGKNTLRHSWYFNESSILFNFGFALPNSPLIGFITLEKPIDYQKLMEPSLK